MKKIYFQCEQCGKIYKTNVSHLNDLDLYIYLYCEECKTQTKQLYCGENIEDKYLYYDLNSDPRYYEY